MTATCASIEIMAERSRRLALCGLAVAMLSSGCGNDFEPQGLEVELSDGSYLEFAAELVEFPNDRGDPIQGVLVAPDSGATGAAVIVMHGSGGLFGEPDSNDVLLEVDHHFSDWADMLAREGHMVLMPSSFYSRGYYDWDGAPNHLDKADRLIMRTHDAYGALHYICDRVIADCDRVGLMGFSNGGSATLMSIYEGLDSVAGMHSLRNPAERESFAHAYAYYPGCGQDGLMKAPEHQFYPTVPLSIFHGTRDSLVDDCPERLDEATEQAQMRGLSEPPMSLTIYDDVGHSFDRDPGNDAEDAAREESRGIVLQGFADNL